MEIHAKLFTDGSEDIKNYNNLFLLYERLWKETWKELGTGGQSMYDDLFRFSYKVGFFLEDTPIAFQGYQLFDLKKMADQNHTYFKRLPAGIMDMLSQQKMRKVATLEYLAVDPAFRKSSGSQVSQILLGFSTQLLATKDIDGIITVTRNDRRVHDLCSKCGLTPLLANFNFYNVATDIMLVSTQNCTLNSDPAVQSVIDKLLVGVGVYKENRKAS